MREGKEVNRGRQVIKIIGDGMDKTEKFKYSEHVLQNSRGALREISFTGSTVSE